MKRYAILAALVVMQICLGGVYAWSALATPLQEVYGLSVAQTSSVFSTTILVFTAATLLTGRWQDRQGPRLPAVTGGVLLGAGYLLGSFSHGRYGFLLATTGAINGLGIACGYACAVPTAVRWFPRRRGLATGLVVAGYGAGALVLAPIIHRLLASGWDVLAVLRALGIGCGSVAVLCGWTLSVPPAPGGQPPAAGQRDGRPVYRDALRELTFWRLTAVFFCVAIAGLTVNPNLAKIAATWGLPAGTGVAAITAWSLGNTSGRLLWGAFSDRIGGRRAILWGQAGGLASVLLLLGGGAAAPWAFLATVGFLAFCYGGNLAIYAPRVAELYGSYRLASLYAILLLAHGSASKVGNWFNGLLFERTQSFRPGLGLIACLMAGGLAFWLLTMRSDSRCQPTEH